MDKNNSNQILKEGVCFTAVLAALMLLIIYPDVYSASVKQGLIIFYNNVIPVLLPFFVLTRLLTSFNVLDKAGKKLSPLMQKMYNTGGCSGPVFIISALSGYPVGARMVYDMYSQGRLNQGECARVTAFCSVSGPMFILGSVGMILGNTAWALIILIAHLSGALINGLIYRKYACRNIEKSKELLKNTQQNNDAVYSGVTSLFIVGGYIVIFFMVSDMLLNTGILNPLIYLLNKIFPETISKGLILGVVEMTRGCIEIGKTDGIIAVIAACSIISWGGICVNMQGYAYLKKCGVKFGYFLLTKLTHCIISALICFFLVTISG